jgi:hypothetical protein
MVPPVSGTQPDMNAGNSIDWTPAVARFIDLLRNEPRLTVAPGMEQRVAVQLLFAMLPTLTPLIRDGLQEAAVHAKPGPANARDWSVADIA